MGLIDFVFGVAEAAVSFFSGVASLIESVGLKGISGLVSTIAAIAIPGIGLPELILAIEAIAEVVGFIAKALGLNQEEDEAEEIGFKAEVAEMKPEDFENMAEYNKYISKCEMTEEDKERFEALSEDEKLKYKVMGLGIQILGVESELSITNLAECIRDLSRTEISKEDINECVQECANSGITNMTDINNYLLGKSTIESKGEIGEALTKAIGTRYPEFTADEIAVKLGDMAEKLYDVVE